MNKALRALLVAWAAMLAIPTYAQTSDSTDYRYAVQNPALRCNDPVRPIACVSVVGTPTNNHTALDVNPANISTTAKCGDGTCQATRGETAGTCPADCSGGSAPVGGTCKSYTTPTDIQPATNTGNACDTGTYLDAVDTSQTWNWACVLNTVQQACASPRVQATCKVYTTPSATQPATNASSGCNAGTYADTSDTTQVWKWTCTYNSVATACEAPRQQSTCKTYSGASAAQPARNTATGCTVGTYGDATDSSDSWKWTCTYNSVISSCSSDKQQPACVEYPSPSAAQPATNTASGCQAGTYGDASDTSTQWNWTCSVGSATKACSAARIAATCRVYTADQPKQPATNTAGGCIVGTYADVSDSASQWKWSCTSGVSTASCSANKTQSSCMSYPAESASQPANSSATGCTLGTYADATDNSSSWQWTCTENGVSKTCGAPKEQPVCVTYDTASSVEPATNSAKGCEKGTFADEDDEADTWHWTCKISSAGTTKECTAPRKPAAICNLLPIFCPK